MIAKFIQKPAGSNRGQAPNLIYYILGATKDCAQTEKDHEHSGDKEKVHFIGCSENICVVNPQFKLLKDKVVKLDTNETELEEIIAAFNESESRNERANFPLEHIVLALQPGETLTVVQWHEAVKIYIEEMGYDNCTWMSAMHQDTDQEHAHIALCNISNEPPHNSINPSNKYRLSALARNKIEEKFGLNHTANPFSDKIQIKNPKLAKNQIRNEIRVAIDGIMDANPTISVPDFQRKMWEKGFGTFANLKSNESEIQGMSFSYNNIKIKAGSLGLGYKTKDLFHRGLEFIPHRDLHQVKQLNELETERFKQFEAMAIEAERFIKMSTSDLYTDTNKVTNISALSQEEQEIMQIMKKFAHDYYVVSLLSQEDIEATFERKETFLLDVIKDSVNSSNNKNTILGAIGIDPKFFKSYGDYLKKLDQIEADRLQRENDKAHQRSLAKIQKMVMSLIMHLYSPKKAKKHMLPKIGYDMGGLNTRIDHSPLLILNKREMATMLLQNKTLRIRKDIEHKREYYVKLNDYDKPIFCERPKNTGKNKFYSHENDMFMSSTV